MAGEAFATVPLDTDSIYCANMAELFKVQPQLGYQIDQQASDAIEAVPTRSGPPTLVYKLPGDRSLLLHSRYDPRQEAVRLISKVDLISNLCFVVSGFGMGYHVRELFDQLSEEAFILVLEPDLAVLKCALEHNDFTDMVASRRLVFIHRVQKSDLFDLLQPFATSMMLGAAFIAHPPSEQLQGEYFKSARQMVVEFAQYCRTSLVTSVAISQATCRNIACNLPTYVSTPSIDILMDRFTGFPAIVVAAGPSLAKNMPLLKQAKGRAIIVAVQTVFKPLLANGIVPDYVTSLDYHQISRRFFDGLEDYRDVHLVAEPKASTEVIDIYGGPISLLSNPFAKRCLPGIDDPHAGLRSGSTVAHLAFYLADYMGCSPIVLVGQDLAFTDNLYYAPGNPIHDVWRPEFNRFMTVEMKEWERIVRHRHILKRVQDIQGRQIYTDEQMFTYLQQFERDFANTSSQVIDATEGGTVKTGATLMPLADALERFATREIPPEKWDYKGEYDFHDRSTLRPAETALRKRIAEISALEDLSSEMKSVLEEMVSLIDEQAKLNQRMVRVDELRVKVHSLEEVLHMVCEVGQLGELRRYKQDRLIGASRAQGKDRQRRQLQRDVEYVSNVIKGCGELRTILNEALERFGRANRAGALATRR